MNEHFIQGLFMEEECIDTLSDEKEKTARYQLLDTITEKIIDYDLHIFEYNYWQKRWEIIQRGVIFSPYNNIATLKTKWSKLFAKPVDNQTKKKINYNQFRWHIFSFDIVPALSGTAARNFFDQCQKTDVYMFYQNKPAAYQLLSPSTLKSEDFDFDDDIYIFDTVEKWTYIHTHEMQCGPYFCCVA